jgi:hypothetical protein
MTSGGRALVCATLQEANWSRSSSCWDMSRFKQPSDTLAASSGFGRRSMIASESNQIAESPGGSGRVGDQPPGIPQDSEFPGQAMDLSTYRNGVKIDFFFPARLPTMPSQNPATGTFFWAKSELHSFERGLRGLCATLIVHLAQSIGQPTRIDRRRHQCLQDA